MTECFAYQLDPEGTIALKNSSKYQEHIPNVYAATYILEKLLDEFSVQYCGDLSKTLAQTTPRTSRKIIETAEKHLNRLKKFTTKDERTHWLTDHLVIKTLLGKKQLGVLNADVTEGVHVYQDFSGIKAITSIHRAALHKVVILEIPLIDIGTGEITPSIVDAVSDVLETSRYKHIIYSTGRHSIAALINFGSPRSYKQARYSIIEICRKVNASAPTYIRAENSSLKTPLPIPLSITNQNHYCNILGKGAGESIEVIASFLDYSYERPEETLSPEEQLEADEERDVDEAPKTSEDPFRWRIRNDFVVTRAFYTGINKLIGKDKHKDKIRKLIGYLLFSPFRNNEGDLVLSSRKLCILLFADDKRVDQNNFNLMSTLKLLDPFVSITTEQHRYKEKKATILKTAEFRQDINALATEEYKSLRKDLVWLSDGESCKHYEDYKIQQQIEKANSSKLMYPCPIARELMITLNSLSAHTFTRAYNQNIDPVMGLVEGMDLESKQDARWKLKQIRLQPIPIYHQTENSNRLQPSTSLARINKELRREFFSGCYITDLSHCQLSINSMLWKCDGLEETLQHPSAWKLLEEQIGIPKADIKKLIYPYVYNIYSSSQKITVEEWKIKAFLDSDIVKKLIHSRDQFLKDSREIGFREDAFGNKVIFRRGGENSFLSLLSQSYEMYLLEDIFKSYISCKDKNSSKSFQILLYLFDGFIFSCNHRDYERITKDMILSVDMRSKESNILTRLSVTEI
jgi:hypothetical protein